MMSRHGVPFSRGGCGPLVTATAYDVSSPCGSAASGCLADGRPERAWHEPRLQWGGSIWDNRTFYRTHLPDVVTLPQLFRRHGYITGGFGKVFHVRTAEDDRATWDVCAGGRTTPAGRGGEGRNLTGGTVPWCS